MNFKIPLCFFTGVIVLMVVQQKLTELLAEVLSFSAEQAAEMELGTSLLGEIPEFDSMAVVSVIVGIEEIFEFTIDDDDISAETFESIGTLVDFVESKQNIEYPLKSVKSN